MVLSSLGAPQIFLGFLKEIQLGHSSATTLHISATPVRLRVTSTELPFRESLRVHLLDGTDDSFAQCHPNEAPATSDEKDQFEERAAGVARATSTLSRRAGARA